MKKRKHILRKVSKNMNKVSHAKPVEGETFLEVNVDCIEKNSMQPRLQIKDTELKELARSIKLNGLIHPIAVIKVGVGRYILKAGQRRWLAHKLLGLKTIKAIVQYEMILPREDHEKALFEIAIMENTQRDNLHPMELALSLKNAMDKKLYKNHAELSIALGKSKSYVSKVFKVLSLEEEIVQDLLKNKSSNDLESLYEIQKIKDPKTQIDIYCAFVAKIMDRKDIKEFTRKKVSHEKPYSLSNRANKINIQLNVSKLTDLEITNMTDEIKGILKKYIRK